MITTHVLDISRGRPAAGVHVTLERGGGGWEVVGISQTDADGRTSFADQLQKGLYRLTFDTALYFGGSPFFPAATIVFEVSDPSQKVHVPLLASPYAYSTYRGS